MLMSYYGTIATEIASQIFGIADRDVEIGLLNGIMGAGPVDVHGSQPSASVLDTLAREGHIKTRAFSVDINGIDSDNGKHHQASIEYSYDSNHIAGVVVFGGLDTQRFAGHLKKLPMINKKKLHPSQQHLLR
ncbi:hypothetical protein CDD82_5187 [Ophiocordyceps australis]|uniref:Peptidase A1 domain-containing protein n=1 Tax=Ophiocordyceps australis TaxID=1399860 RepID=A0A2C5Z3K4_9HYPO|nr:hypothetical protein CDD82_5187 [Ophiocordyceps australis]